jgi:hypothetical protein
MKLRGEVTIPAIIYRRNFIKSYMQLKNGNRLNEAHSIFLQSDHMLKDLFNNFKTIDDK